MMKTAAIMIALGLIAGSARAYNITPEIVATGMKTVVVTTIDGEEPVCESVNAPEGCWGIGITNVNKVPGRVRIVDSDGEEIFDSGEYVKKESGMTIKVRGNTSAINSKKPFKIKLEKKGDLLTRDDKDLRDKNWVLLTSRNNLYELGFLIGKWIGMPWAPAYEYVHLVMNGDYRGVYTLTEAVERNEKCRIQTEETGFVAERDPYWWNQNGEFFPSGWNPRYNWTMKYPDFEDLTEEQTRYITGVLKQYEEILQTPDYEDMIDIDSFCRWVIAQDILGTSDGGGTNFYVARKDDTGKSKIYIPVLWDVDSGEETEDAWSNVHNQPVVSLLWGNSNTRFKERYVELYREFSPVVYENIEQLTKEMNGVAWENFDKAVKLNNERWGEDAQYTASHNAYDMAYWFPARKRWLDSAVEEIADALENAYIESPETERSHVISVYNLQGYKIYEGPEDGFAIPAPGIYLITKGDKTLKVRY